MTNENRKSSVSSQTVINSLTGIKAIAMLLLFWWHSSIPSPNVDLGARTCELLFVTSGFLVGYNYYSKDILTTWNASFEYFFKKVIKFWPLHILVLFLMLLVTFVLNGCLTVENLLVGIVNGLLLQAWSHNPDVYFSYNGASWFLSALVFCYFMSPLLLRFSKKVKQSIILFVIVFAIRYFLEYLNVNCTYDIFDIHIHISPIIRCLEFFMGMLIIPLFISIRDKKLITDYLVNSIVELLTMVITVFFVIQEQGKWLRGTFVILFCAFVFIFAFNSGLISKIFSLKIFKLFGKIQFEFFIFHQALIVCITGVCSSFIFDWRILNLIIFVSIILCSIIYKIFFENRLSIITKKGIEFLIKTIK